RSAEICLITPVTAGGSGRDDRSADLAKLLDLVGCQDVDQRCAYLLDMTWCGSGQSREAFVRELRDLAAAVGRAVSPLHPAAFLEPGYRVGQPALAVRRRPRELGHSQRPAGRLGQVHEDLVVPVRQPGIADELCVGCREDRLARLQEQAPGALLLIAQP